MEIQVALRMIGSQVTGGFPRSTRTLRTTECQTHSWLEGPVILRVVKATQV